MKRISIALALLALSAVGCSAHVDGGSGSGPTTFHQVPSANSTPTVLEGKWSTGCVGNSGVYLSAVFTFAGNTSTGTMTFFGDSACTQSLQQQTQSGTFTIGGPSTVAGATNIDYTNSNGTNTYDIFEISGSTLYFGANPGSSANARSTMLNTGLPFTKTK